MHRCVCLGAGIAALLVLSACTGGVKAECTSEEASSVTIDLIKNQLEKAVRTKADNPDVLNSAIRATIAQLKIVLEDVRTSKVDPNSTKRFCTAKLKVVVPDNVLADASQARSDAGLSDISHLADSSNVERNANAFSSDIDYNVQPTDDGKKIYSEVSAAGANFDFYGELLASHLLRRIIERNKSAEEQAAAQQQQEEERAAAEQAAAQSQSAQADLEGARAENRLANQALSAAWKLLPPGTRSQLKPLQLAWIKKKDADCFLEAASATTDPIAREAARLRCDTRAAQERMNWIKPYLNTEPTPEDDSGGTTGM